MSFLPNEIYGSLKAKNIHRFYHANSVKTSCNFIRHSALLSRGAVEKKGLEQTSQYTDSIDKQHKIWSSVFVDSVDIHDRANMANDYGPVLFVMDIQIIEPPYAAELGITKLNPTKWNNRSEQERWFQSRADHDEGFLEGEFDQMIVASNNEGTLPFNGHLQEIILDDPGTETLDGRKHYRMAHSALTTCLQESGLKVPINRRECNGFCSCSRTWKDKATLTGKMFIP